MKSARPEPRTYLRRAYVHAYNYTNNYDSHWSRLEYGAQASLSLAATPGPAVAGPQASTNIQLPLNPVGAQLQMVSGACTSLPCSIANLAVGATVTITATYLVTATAGSNITASPRLTSDSVDCVPADNQLSLTIPVLPAAPVAVPVPMDDRRALALLLALLASFGAWSLRRHETAVSAWLRASPGLQLIVTMQGQFRRCGAWMCWRFRLW